MKVDICFFSVFFKDSYFVGIFIKIFNVFFDLFQSCDLIQYFIIFESSGIFGGYEIKWIEMVLNYDNYYFMKS